LLRIHESRKGISYPYAIVGFSLIQIKPFWYLLRPYNMESIYYVGETTFYRLLYQPVVVYLPIIGLPASI
tara:strand:+ start:1009 stop:1218 length:210 start_codon:yes stop_codon:yes gene_type:complete